MAYQMQDREKFSDRLESPEAYVGYRLCDPQGQDIGPVKRLFVNDYDEPEYIEVKMGFLGRKVVLIPITGVALNEQKKTLVLQ